MIEKQKEQKMKNNRGLDKSDMIGDEKNEQESCEKECKRKIQDRRFYQQHRLDCICIHILLEIWNFMVENIKLKIVDSHEDILNIIDKNVGTLINFDWHADYPSYPEKIFDVDSYSDMILKNNQSIWLNNNWVPVLISKGFVNKYIWMYPHECAKDEIKRFKAKKGDCEVYSIKFQGKIKLPYKFITIDMDFFGTRVPFNWNPKDRRELFIDMLESLTARNLTMIIAKSNHYVNYNVDKFLDDMKREMYERVYVEEI